MNILNISINNGEATITAPWDCYTGTISVLGIIHEFRLYYKRVKASTINFINHIIEVILPKTKNYNLKGWLYLGFMIGIGLMIFNYFVF